MLVVAEIDGWRKIHDIDCNRKTIPDYIEVVWRNDFKEVSPIDAEINSEGSSYKRFRLYFTGKYVGDKPFYRL